ncbi:MAG: DNA-binding protein [Mesorhizobium sp.]|nr:MAG: DNA-binding protein [Mesorhizobium sp.]
MGLDFQRRSSRKRAFTNIHGLAAGFSIVRWMSTRQLAEALGVSDRTIRYWAARGTIPGAIRIGRQFRFRLTEVEVWLDNMDVSHHQQRKVHQWPTSTLETDQKSIKRVSASETTPSVSQLDLDVQRLLNKRQTALRKS